MNLFVQTGKSMDQIGTNVLPITENNDLTQQKTPFSISKSLICKNLSNIDKNVISDSHLPKTSKLNKNMLIESNRETIRTPEKNRGNIISPSTSRNHTENGNLKKYGTKNMTSFLSTSITNCSAYKINPDAAFEGIFNLNYIVY